MKHQTLPRIVAAFPLPGEGPENSDANAAGNCTCDAAVVESVVLGVG